MYLQTPSLRADSPSELTSEVLLMQSNKAQRSLASLPNYRWSKMRISSKLPLCFLDAQHKCNHAVEMMGTVRIFHCREDARELVKC